MAPLLRVGTCIHMWSILQVLLSSHYQNPPLLVSIHLIDWSKNIDPGSFEANDKLEGRSGNLTFRHFGARIDPIGSAVLHGASGPEICPAPGMESTWVSLPTWFVYGPGDRQGYRLDDNETTITHSPWMSGHQSVFTLQTPILVHKTPTSTLTSPITRKPLISQTTCQNDG